MVDSLSSPLSAGDVCAILDACMKSGASSLTFQGLHVEFSLDRSLPRTAALGFGVGRPEGEEEALIDAGGGIVKPAKVHFTPEEEQVLEDARLSQLMTDDPLAYEQEMIDSHSEGQTHGEGTDA